MKTIRQNKTISYDYKPSGNLKDIIGSTCDYESIRCRITSTWVYIDERWPGNLCITIRIVPIEEHNFDEDELSYMRGGVSVDELSCFNEKPRESDVTSGRNKSERAEFVYSATKKAVEKRKEQGFPMTYRKRQMYEMGFEDAVEWLLGNKS